MHQFAHVHQYGQEKGDVPLVDESSKVDSNSAEDTLPEPEISWNKLQLYSPKELIGGGKTQQDISMTSLN